MSVGPLRCFYNLGFVKFEPVPLLLATVCVCCVHHTVTSPLGLPTQTFTLRGVLGNCSWKTLAQLSSWIGPAVLWVVRCMLYKVHKLCSMKLMQALFQRKLAFTFFFFIVFVLIFLRCPCSDSHFVSDTDNWTRCCCVTSAFNTFSSSCVNSGS